MAERLKVALASSLNAPRHARKAIMELLTRSGRTDLGVDAALAVSELVTNAVVHAGGPITLSASYVDSTLHVEVHDTERALPSVRNPPPSEKTGRGLNLVALLADRWSVTPTAGGKTIWFEMS
ncbi:MAG TPA: ATP-binding protein [Acidimicrobiales bacterium]